MRRLCTALALVLAATLAVVVTTTSPASAVVRVNDPHDAPYPQDTRSMRLFPDYRGFVVVQLYSRTWRAGARFNGIDVTLDVRGSGDADYRLSWAFGKDGDGYENFRLYRVNGPDTVAATRCRAIDARSRGQLIELSVSRSCLGVRKAVRARATTWDYTRYRHGRPVRGVSDVTPNHGLLS